MRKYVYVFEQKCTMICEGKAYKHKSSQAVIKYVRLLHQNMHCLHESKRIITDYKYSLNFLVNCYSN